ncbi:MAG: ATP-binding cassette domain-containing protein [Elusimicrobiota bacterium]
MIETINLHKSYGSFSAVRGVGFTIGKGEIVGFLGPNGAGKTTTIRMLAGYLPPSSGTVSILGKDMATDALQIRRQVGYLPENNPLYEAMEVSEYLVFHWQARRLGDAVSRRQRIAEVAKSCGLESVLGKELKELSKGFKQRVGLAAALIHDPAVLLLDEPTSGLDPTQAREVRELILSLRHEKTILLTTHILSEVQSLCNRVIVIHKGAIVADKPLAELSVSQEFVVTMGFSQELNGGAAGITAIDGVLALDGPVPVGGTEYHYRLRAARDVRKDIFDYAASKKLPLVELKMEKRSLEEVFHELTR